MTLHGAIAAPSESQWLLRLLAAKFFTPCVAHPAAKKNEANIYCMTCFASLCHHCVPHHAGHKMLQVRRYVYHDVVRLHDINKMVDCNGVQPYIINSARVVFLNERIQPRPTKAHNSCASCERSLQDEYQFCSLGCKVAAADKALGRPPRAKAPTSKLAPQSVDISSKLAASRNASSTSTTSSTMSGNTHMKEAEGVLPSRRSTSPDGSSGLSEDDITSDDDSMGAPSLGGPFPSLSAPKRMRTGRGYAAGSVSPKSVLPEMSSGTIRKMPVGPILMMPPFIAVSPKRRKSAPQRAPAF